MGSPFDPKAAAWDQQAYRVARARSIAEKIGAVVPVAAGARVLDFGCGTGLLGFHFVGEGRTVTFADTSSAMLDQVRAKGQPAFEVRLHLLPGPLEGPFDLIVSLMVLHHIEDHRAAIAELCGCLAPGGALCLADLDAEDGSFHTDEKVPHNGFAREEIEKILQANGLKQTASDTGFVNRKVVAGFEREYRVFLIIGKKP